MTLRWLSITLMSLALANAARAVDPPAPTKPRLDASGLLPALSGGSPDSLAGALRGYLVHSLPSPLYESWPGWGHTKRGALDGKPKNDGRWRHIRVDVLTPADTLVFDIRDLQQAEPGRITFTVFLSFDARFNYEYRHFESGIRLRSSSAKARLRVRSTLQCEATFRLEPGAALLPEAVFRLHVVRSDLRYDNLVMEHIAGVGGDAAEILGEAIHGGLKRWHPSLERDLLAKANASIEKAADTKEVRVSLYDLVKKKGWLGAAPAGGEPAKPPPTPVPVLGEPGA